MTDQELLELAQAASANAYAPYSKFHVGAAALLRDGRVITGVNVENAAYPLGVCAERCVLSRAAAEACRPGDVEAVADHRVALRRLPAVARRVPGRPRRSSRTRARCSRGGPTSSCRTRSCCEVGVRRGRRASERREVDARERARRRQGGDRLGQAADDPAADLGGGRRRARGRAVPARPRRPARLPAAARRADRADAADGRRGARGRRRLPLRPRRRRGDRRRRPLHRRARLRGGPARDRRAQQGRPGRPGPDRRADRDGRRARRLPRAPSGERTHRRRPRAAPRRPRRSCFPRGRATSRRGSAPTSRSRPGSPRSCARRRSS